MIQDVSDITSFKWATVRGVSPLSIQLDGDANPLALIPDSIIDPMELIAGDRVRVELSLRKCVIHGAASGGGQSGEIKITAAPTAPRGWLLAQGQSLLRSAYPRLFTAIGVIYGTLDATHFSLPDMQGRVAVGSDSSQIEFDVLGEKGGAKAHTLTVAEMPSHSHRARIGNVSPGDGSGFRYANNDTGFGIVQNEATGGQGPHNNLQPYIVLNYIIKL